jgi:hypothetical protein
MPATWEKTTLGLSQRHLIQLFSGQMKVRGCLRPIPLVRKLHCWLIFHFKDGSPLVFATIEANPVRAHHFLA